MYDNYRRLCFSIAKQAVTDYFDPAFSNEKNKILKDLRSEWMMFLTDGMSEVIAEQLELHPHEIKERFKKADGRLGGI